MAGLSDVLVMTVELVFFALCCFFLFSFGFSFASCFVNLFERTQMVVILLYVPKYSAE